MSKPASKQNTGLIDLSGPKDAPGNVAGAEPIKVDTSATPQLKLSLMILTQAKELSTAVKKKITDKRFTAIKECFPKKCYKNFTPPLAYTDKVQLPTGLAKNVQAVICYIKDF